MPLYEIQQPDLTLREIAPSTFSDLQIRERAHLQAMLRDTPGVIAPDLFVFAEEFSDWQESLRRIDLLALDKEANLVIIELKRVEEGGHMELQALRYAAMLSTVDFDGVVAAYEKMLENPEVARKRGYGPDQAREALLEFLGATDEVVISDTPRIILMAPSFSKEITTTILWLNEKGLDLRCVQVRPYQLGDVNYLDVEQVIPLPSADDYIVRRREKTEKVAATEERAKRRRRSIAILEAAGVLQKDMSLHLVKDPKPGLNITDEKAKQAVYLGDGNVRWELDGQVYSLSGLCLEICMKFSETPYVGSGAFPGPDFWAIEGDTVPLNVWAKQVEANTV